MLVTFQSNEFLLEGFSHDVKTDKCVIICHGYESNKEVPRYLKLADHFVSANIAVLRFDFTGHGNSTGELSDFSVEKGVHDICQAVAFATQKGYTNIALVGLSIGAMCGLLCAAQHDLFSHVALIAPGGPNYEEFVTKVSHYKKPVFLIHGTNDRIVPLPQSQELANNLAHVEFEMVLGADHTFTQHTDLLVHMVCSFIEEKWK